MTYYQNEVKGDFQKSEPAGRVGNFENETGLLRVCAKKPINPKHVI